MGSTSGCRVPDESAQVALWQLTQEDITQISKPTRALDLSFLSMHQDYLIWAQEKPDLRKETKSVFYVHQFYSDDANNELIRVLFESGKASYLKSVKEIHESQQTIAKCEAATKAFNEETQAAKQEIQAAEQETQAAKQEIQTAKQETQAAKQEIQAAKQRTQAVNQKIKQAMNNFLLGKLRQYFVDVALPGADQVKRRFDALVVEAHQRFDEDEVEIKRMALGIVRTNELFINIRSMLSDVMAPEAGPRAEEAASAPRGVQGTQGLETHGMFAASAGPQARSTSSASQQSYVGQ